jgi:hypothetical protein
MVIEILRQGAGWNLGLIDETAIQNVFRVTDEDDVVRVAQQLLSKLPK